MSEVGDLPRPPAKPCGSCPYRQDVPSAIWSADEYEKLPEFDGEMWQQSRATFFCHQNDGRLCAGWLACHGSENLLALRLRAVHPSAYDYVSPVPVFASGAEACAHGLRDLEAPSPEAERMIGAIISGRSRRVR